MDFFGAPGGDKFAQTGKTVVVKKTTTIVSKPRPEPPKRPSYTSLRNGSSHNAGSSKTSLKPTDRGHSSSKLKTPKRGGSSLPPTSSPSATPKRRRAAISSSSSSESSEEEGRQRSSALKTRRKLTDPKWDDVSQAKPAAKPRSQVYDIQGLENAAGQHQVHFIQSSDLVKQNINKYRHYFNPSEQNGLTSDQVPEIELTYPRRGCSERFALMQPRHHNEYHPIQEVLNSIQLMVDHYVPPSHLHKFRHKQTDGFFDSQPLPLASLAQLSDPPPSSPSTPQRSHPGTPAPQTTDPILRALHKAYNRKDYAAFRIAIGRFNQEFALLRDQGEIRTHLSQGHVEGERWKDMVMALGESCYQRTVGPATSTLSEYEPFSDYVYGELLPQFVFTIADRAKLGRNSSFVDLGSGVGNCLGNISLYTGSSSIGCEYMPNPSLLARNQIKEVKARWAMWAVRGNDHCRAIQADFCANADIVKELQKADLVLVNNYAFTPSLNDRLSLLFLELKDNTKIISLKPFLPDKFRLNDRNASSPSAILRMRELPYPAGSVSWTNEGGVYYEHVVDRGPLREFFEGAAGARRSGSRR